MACRVSNINCLRAYPPSTPRFSPKCHHQNPNSPPLLLNNHSFPPPPTLKPRLPKQVITKYVLSFLLFSINNITNGEYCPAVSVFHLPDDVVLRYSSAQLCYCEVSHGHCRGDVHFRGPHACQSLFLDLC